MEQTDATMLLGAFDGRNIIVIDKEEPFTNLRVAASIGMHLPFCAGAFGQAFLAYLPAAVVDQLLANPGLRAFTAASMTNPDEYRAALATVRAQGYAIDDKEEYLQDVGAISVPIFKPEMLPQTGKGATPKPEVTAVITLVNFSSRLSPQKIAEFIPWMVEAGQKISETLGCKLNPLKTAE
jgi:DNA-binding IclR family transcriptional regulator